MVQNLLIKDGYNKYYVNEEEKLITMLCEKSRTLSTLKFFSHYKTNNDKHSIKFLSIHAFTSKYYQNNSRMKSGVCCYDMVLPRWVSNAVTARNWPADSHGVEGRSRLYSCEM